MSYGECSYKNCDLFGGHTGPHTCAGAEGEAMSAPIPEDLQTLYKSLSRVGPCDTNCNLTYAAVLVLIEEIAALEALNRQLRERIKSRIDYRLNERLCGMKPEWDDSMTGFNDAWDIVREVFKDEEVAALAATEPPACILDTSARTIGSLHHGSRAND